MVSNDERQEDEQKPDDSECVKEGEVLVMCMLVGVGYLRIVGFELCMKGINIVARTDSEKGIVAKEMPCPTP